MMISFKRFLAEGGNVDLGGGLSASRINMCDVDRKTLVVDIVRSLRIFSADFKRTTGFRLFGAKVFTSGSTEHLFNLKGITDEDFKKVKPAVGDIDVQIDKSLESFVIPFVAMNKGNTFGKGKLLGHKTSAGTVITLWKFECYGGNIQVDLELVDFADGRPTEWSKLSHSSSWADMQEGVKGVFHKYLIQAIDARNLREVYIQSPAGKKMKKQQITNIAFSVTRGVRFKYKPVLNERGEQKQVDGLFVYTEMPTSESNFVTDPNEMLKILIGKQPSTQDRQDFDSFTGLLDMLKRHFTKVELKKVGDGFTNALWGKGRQALYRGDQNRDLEEKTVAFNLMKKRWGVRIKPDPLIKQYYV